MDTLTSLIVDYICAGLTLEQAEAAAVKTLRGDA